MSYAVRYTTNINMLSHQEKKERYKREYRAIRYKYGLDYVSEEGYIMMQIQADIHREREQERRYKYYGH